MLEQLAEIDQRLFLGINKGLSNGFFDVFLPFMRNEIVWIPLYVLIAIFFIWKFKSKGVLWLTVGLISVGIADLLSSQLIKKSIMRARPCHIEHELVGMILRVDCGTGFSFTSSHAANHMALAVFIFCTTMVTWKHWRWLFLPWALIIGFAQIYVGVHYPFDVLCGFILGSLVGFSTSYVYLKSKWNINIEESGVRSQV